MPRSELLHSQPRQQLEQMASTRRIALRVYLPHINRNPELIGDDIENGGIRTFVSGQHSAWMPEIAHQYGNAEAVVVAAMLPNKSNVCLRQRVQPNQLSLIRREGQQFKAL